MTYRQAVKHIRKLEQENEKLRERNKELEKRCNQKLRRYLRGGLQQRRIVDLESKYNDMKAERDTLIDDLPWYKAKISRLERENEKFKESHIKHITNMENYYKDRVQELKEDNKRMERENEKLRKEHYNGWKQKDEVINNLISNIKSKDNLLSEISKHIGRKPASSTYKSFRAKLDGIGIKEDE